MSLQSPYARLVAMVGCKLLIKLFRECVILNEVKDPARDLATLTAHCEIFRCAQNDRSIGVKVIQY